MPGDVGYLIVTGAVWAALIFLLMVAVIGLLRSRERERRHRRRHHLVELRRAIQEAPRPAAAPPEPLATPPAPPAVAPPEPTSPTARPARPPAWALEDGTTAPAAGPLSGRTAAQETAGESDGTGASPASPA